MLNGLSQKIFSALPAISEENGEQTIIFRMIGRESSEESKERIEETIKERIKAAQKPIHPLQK
jgi:hypothetical protein